jgi:hypothetical protein
MSAPTVLELFRHADAFATLAAATFVIPPEPAMIARNPVWKGQTPQSLVAGTRAQYIVHFLFAQISEHDRRRLLYVHRCAMAGNRDKLAEFRQFFDDSNLDSALTPVQMDILRTDFFDPDSAIPCGLDLAQLRTK